MAGVATAYSTDALTSSGVTDNEKWEFAVPISADVGFLPWIFPFFGFVGSSQLLVNKSAQQWTMSGGFENGTGLLY